MHSFIHSFIQCLVHPMPVGCRMFGVGGGRFGGQVCNRLRGDRYRGGQRMTLPYPPYLTLPYLTYLTLPYSHIFIRLEPSRSARETTPDSGMPRLQGSETPRPRGSETLKLRIAGRRTADGGRRPAVGDSRNERRETVMLTLPYLNIHTIPDILLLP